MKTYIVVFGVAVAVLAWSGALAAHHSLARFDTTTPVWVTGTVIRIERINPHSLIVIDQPRSHQPAQRWVIDGPSPNVLARMRLADDFVMPGEVLTVCGFVLKDDAATDSARQISGHLLVLPNGKRQFWSDYGVFQKCLTPGEETDTYRREALGGSQLERRTHCRAAWMTHAS
jgi:hypothetical protein